MIRSTADHHYDVAIVGGGMIGLSLAAALKDLPLDVAVIEPLPPGDQAQPSFDDRCTALANGSRRILQGIGVWESVAAEATAIRQIHVSERGRLAMARITAGEQGVAALGYTLVNRVLGRGLAAACHGAGRLELLVPGKVTGLTANDSLVELTVEGGHRSRIAARLVVAADGAHSRVREACGIEASVADYGQLAVIANLGSERLHNGVAYERFTDRGPMALLPLSGGRIALVWTLPPDEAKAVLQMDDGAFLAELQHRFGYRLGRFTRVGLRQSYPLSLSQASRQLAGRVVLIGNAAQGLHPVAGQGFNLGLRDVATLAEVIADEIRTRGGDADPGSAAALERYVAWRATDRRTVIRLTDGLVRLFGNPLPPVRLARDAGLLFFDLAEPAKHAFARAAMGLSGHVPRLARGLPL